MQIGRIVGAVLFAASAVACGGSSSPEKHTATLAAANEVPAATSNATGSATFTVNGSGDTATVAWTLTASGLTSAPTGAHIHPGVTGANGGVAVPLPYTAGADGTSNASR